MGVEDELLARIRTWDENADRESRQRATKQAARTAAVQRAIQNVRKIAVD